MSTKNYDEQFTKGKLYVGAASRCCVMRDDVGRDNGFTGGSFGDHFKFVKTKPFEDAEIGDTLISLIRRDGCREVNDIFTIKKFPATGQRGYYYLESTWGDAKGFAVLDLLPEEHILDLSAIQM